MPRAPILQVSISHVVGSLSLHVIFTADASWTVLFAPSGAGKTTVLRIIAGLERPERGEIAFAATASGEIHQNFVLIDTPKKIFVPPNRRRFPYLAQSTPLFPHMTVLENISYGMIRSSIENSSPERYREHQQELLSLCRITKLAGKMPETLSGGERQRVALARALGVTGCRMLLLDEPFTALDTVLREEIVGELRVWLARRNIPVLQVTHDVGEIFALQPDVVCMRDGRVISQGPAAHVLREERTWLKKQLA